MSNIQAAFRSGKAFIPFVTCGDPDLETTARIVRAMADSGADLIERRHAQARLRDLHGVFHQGTVAADQCADARAAGAEALGHGIDMVQTLRRDVAVPMVFMTYANVVFSYGVQRFAEACAEIGMDGLILPDVPFEEKEEFAPACRSCGLELISLVAPTSEHRIARIAREAEGFVYIVSSLGVTGVRSEIQTDIAALTALVRQDARVPCAVGFGISTPEQAAAMARHADGVIVGSAIVKIIAQHGKACVPYVADYVKSMKQAIAGLESKEETKHV